MAERKYWLWLANLRGVSGEMKLALLRHFENDPEAVYWGESGEYRLVEGMSRSALEALENKSTEAADRILGRCDEMGLRILAIRDTDYPDRLRNIYNPPLLLYVQGRMPQFDEEVAVAMVGSRRISAYGLEAGERLAFQLASLGAVVVSGLAAGGDSAAHRGALRAGGLTVGVIGGGHDILYPRASRCLYEDLAVRGAILSEYPPGTGHQAAHFPVRNRIISGLCQAVVVIEAPEASGALITASRALDQGRDVFALPGQVGDWHCVGSNLLLRDGAGLVTDAWDILVHYKDQFPHKIRDMRLEEPQRFGGGPVEEKPPKAAKPPKGQKAKRPTLSLSGDHGLTDDQIRVVKVLRGRTMQVDDIIEETQVPARRVLSALTMLEIDRIVSQDSGKRFTLEVTLL